MPKSNNPETGTEHKKPLLPRGHLLVLLKQKEGSILADPLSESGILKGQTLGGKCTRTASIPLVPRPGEDGLGVSRKGNAEGRLALSQN